MGRPDGRPWIEVGTNTHVAYVFSCPGADERIERRPVAGQTGNYLNRVIAHLHRWNLDWIPTREDATITNAWTRVEHTQKESPGWTNRTQGEEEDVLQPVNLKRLERELADITDWIICFGDRAHWALDALKAQNRLAARVVHVRHLTHMSLLHVKNALDGTPISDIPDGEKHDAQLAVVAAQIAQQMGHQPEGVQLPGDDRINPYVIHGAEGTPRTDEVWLRRVAEAVRAALVGVTGFPREDCQNASVGLAMVLEGLGLAAWTVRGAVRLNRAIPEEDGDPNGLYEEFTHWWVESCGIWIDLTFGQLAGLEQQPPAIGLWPAWGSAHHVPGVDDHEGMNEAERELRAGAALQRVVREVVEHLQHD